MFSAKTFTLALQSLALAAVASPLATRGADFCKTWTESSPDKAIGVFDVVLGQGYYIQAKSIRPEYDAPGWSNEGRETRAPVHSGCNLGKDPNLPTLAIQFSSIFQTPDTNGVLTALKVNMECKIHGVPQERGGERAAFKVFGKSDISLGYEALNDWSKYGVSLTCGENTYY